MANSSYRISENRGRIIQNSLSYHDTDKKLVRNLIGLKDNLRKGTITTREFLDEVRKIKQSNPNINELFKPANEFSYWFTSANGEYRADRMAKIIEGLEQELQSRYSKHTISDKGKESIEDIVYVMGDFSSRANLTKVVEVFQEISNYINIDRAAEINPKKAQEILRENAELLGPKIVAKLVTELLESCIHLKERDKDDVQYLEVGRQVLFDHAKVLERGTVETFVNKLFETYIYNEWRYRFIEQQDQGAVLIAHKLLVDQMNKLHQAKLKPLMAALVQSCYILKDKGKNVEEAQKALKENSSLPTAILKTAIFSLYQHNNFDCRFHLLVDYEEVLGLDAKNLMTRLFWNYFENECGKAGDLLIAYNDHLNPEEFGHMVNRLFERCISKNHMGYMKDAKTAQHLLREYVHVLKGEGRELVIQLIELCSDEITRYYIPSELAKVAKGLLSEHQKLLGIDKSKQLVIQLIEKCSVRGNYSEGDNLSKIAIELIKEHQSSLTQEEIDEIVIQFFNTCTDVEVAGQVADVRTAEELLKECNHMLSSQISKKLVIKLIEMRSNIREIDKAQKLIVEYQELLGPDERKRLVFELIERCSSFIFDGRLRNALGMRTLLEEHREWLSRDYNELYSNWITRLFNYDNQYTRESLQVFAEDISEEVIIRRYESTNSISVIQAIREYVQGSGRHRRINLPPRLDMMVNGRPLAGIAFEVHNFTDGIETAALGFMQEFLKSIGAPVDSTFSLDDLRSKINLIQDAKLDEDGELNKAKNEERRNKALQALNKLLQSEDYANKLKKILPIIAAFLNLSNDIWESDYTSQESRWDMWLVQSFVEAGYAYAGEGDTLSCVKGIYERLFTGFRTMHPIIDCLFVVKNITTGYEKNLPSLIVERKDEVVAKLQEHGVTGNEADFENKVKEVYTQLIQAELATQIKDQLDQIFNKLTSEELLPLRDKMQEHVFGSWKSIRSNVFSKVKEFIANIEYIPSFKDDSASPVITDYIKDKLKGKEWIEVKAKRIL